MSSSRIASMSFKRCREIVIKYLPFPTVGFAGRNQPDILPTFRMDDHQHGIWREHAHGDFAYFAVRFAVIDFCENRTVKNMGSFLEADAMLCLVFSIFVYIPFKFHGYI